VNQKLQIRVKIADREYPLEVSMEDEERMRKAAKLVQDRIEEFKYRMKAADMQDILAMVAFDAVNLKMKYDFLGTQQENDILERLNQMERKLKEGLLTASK
jgi:cell division protein ZapA